MRLFIAVDLPERLKELLSLLIVQKKQTEGVKLVSKENLHITLKFLGEVNEFLIPAISDKLKAIAKAFNPFVLKISHPGAFPNSNFPQVVWLGVENEVTIKKLANTIEESLKSMGFKREERDFKSHITLARVKEPKKGRQFFEAVNARFIELHQGHSDFRASLSFEVKEFVLMKSILTSKGSIYEILQRFPLVE